MDRVGFSMMPVVLGLVNTLILTGHILCNNSFVFFSSRRAPAGMLCLVKGLLLQGRDKLLEPVQFTELLGLNV